MQHGFVRVRPEYDIRVTTQQPLDRVPDCLASVTTVRQNPFQPEESVKLPYRMPSKTERSEYFLNLSLGSNIFFITCHCLSARLVGYLCITLLY